MFTRIVNTIDCMMELEVSLKIEDCFGLMVHPANMTQVERTGMAVIFADMNFNNISDRLKENARVEDIVNMSLELRKWSSEK